MAALRALFVIGIVQALIENCHGAQYFGKLIGKLSELHHGVSGEVYAVDARTLYIKDFTYDGQGPAAYFYASLYKAADKNGFRLRDESGSGEVIRRYRKEGVTLTLPEGNTLHNIKIFYLWCEDYDTNFGDVKIPRNFDYPRPQKIEGLKGIHGVSSDNIVIVDAQTLLIPNLSYDGQAPDAKFWVGRGNKPSPRGIRVPDENGKEVPLRRYEKKTVVLTLPGDLTVFDIGHFGVWCELFTVDFGHVLIPQNINIPPSLKMLGVSPQSKLNCEVLYDNLAFEVRWAVAGESIVLQLVAKLDDGEYMSFGLSGDETKTVMIGGDVVVAWIDKETSKGHADDYYLEDKSQCSGPTGSCPDNRLAENTNSIRLLNSAIVNGYSIVTYQRPLRASDQYDLPIHTNKSQAIIWAVGPLNQRSEVSFHSRYLKKIHLIDFGRAAKWNCPMPETEQSSMTAVSSVYTQSPPADVKSNSSSEEDYYEEPTTKKTNGRRRISQKVTQKPQDNADDSQNNPSGTKQQTQPSRRKATEKEHARPTQNTNSKIKPWTIPPIQCDEPENGVFYAQMGPAGGKRGYPSITGHVGWGIAWYINGLLIPEIYVVRGRTYTFVVEGGLDPEVSAKYHPFYITDDPVGGYEYKTPEEKRNVSVFAGTRKTKDGSVEPTGTGRLCHWTETSDMDADDFRSFGAYQRTLELKCDPGEPGLVEWTPDQNTPDIVYYQCYTHRYLGWKIHVVDSCDQQPAASESKPSIVPAPREFLDKADIDLEDSPSTFVETRVKQINIIRGDNEDKDSKSIISEKVVSANLPNPLEQFSPLNPFEAPAQQNFQPIHSKARPTFFSYHQPQHPHFFKPSTLLNTGIESTKAFTEYTTSTSTTTTSTITTEKSTTPKSTDNLAVATDNLNVSYLLPPPPHYRERVVYRRPTNYLTVPIKMVPPPQMGVRYYSGPALSYKKPSLRIPYHRYKPMFGSPYVIQARPLAMVTNAPFDNKFKLITEKPIVEAKHVEVSTAFTSTEREPEIQTAPSTLVADIAPIFFPPAYNTGFKPGSIKIESGFKPIITKEFEERMDKDDSLIENVGQTGILYVNGSRNNEIDLIHLFEPMFIPSPIYKPEGEKKVKVKKIPLTKKKHQITKIVIKRPRSLSENLEELVADSNERVESYYLPPTNVQPVDRVREPSGLDIDLPESSLMLGSPPDVVITYDGKKLSGHSLTAKLSDRSSVISPRLSKGSAFIIGRPQFGQFKGELPPLNIDYINKNAPQLQSSAGVLNRELDTPLPSENEQKVVSLKLSRVKSYEQ